METRFHHTPSDQAKRETPAKLGFGIVGAPKHGAGLSNVATIIGELLANSLLEVEKLASVGAIYPATVAQRVGYMVDFMASEFGAGFDTAPLRELVAGSRYRPLSPLGQEGHRDPRWHIVANTPIEHDL